MADKWAEASGSATDNQQTGNSAPTTSHYPSSSHNPYASLVTGSNLPRTPHQPYQMYSHHMNWQSTWPMNSMYAGGASAAQTSSHCPQPAYAPYQAHYYPMQVQQAATSSTKAIAPSQGAQNHGAKMGVEKPPSPPPPLIYEHWDEAIRQFLQDAGLTQAMKGFECDMFVLNSDWEREQIPLALERLIKGLGSTRELQLQKEEEASKDVSQASESGRSIDDRKLDYVHLTNGKKPRSPTSINKDISAFLARNRALNDASNRAEFLLSLAEKRRRAQQNDSGDDDDDDQIPSCARVDARTIDREAQMKYDIAKNDDGPLRRTKKDGKQIPAPQSSTSNDPLTADEQNALPRHHPGIDERLSNLESHLAVRYVPSPPRTLWARLKFLEDHVIRLEKDYPPWAALHFNQPNRGWPPPPRATPIIVPPHLRSSDATESSTQANPGSYQSQGPLIASSSSGSSKTRNTRSSLQRAVLERLEVQQAMGEKTNITT